MLEALVERDPSHPDRTLRAWLPPGLHPPQVQLLNPKPASEVMMVRSLSCAPVDHSVWWATDVF